MILLDTHFLLWSVYTPDRLPHALRSRLENAGQAVSFSLASVWEVAIKSSLKRPDFAVNARAFHRELVSIGFAELPLTAQHVIRVSTLPWIHRDPFDRLLVAQAAVDGLKLHTADAALAGYGRMVKMVRFHTSPVV